MIRLKWKIVNGIWSSRYKGIPIRRLNDKNAGFLVIWDKQFQTKCNSIGAVVEIIDSREFAFFNR